MAMATAAIFAEAWDFITTLSDYRRDNDGVCVGWYRHQPYARIWNYKTGRHEWRPFVTSRPEPPKPPRYDPFAGNNGLYALLFKND